MNFYFDMEFTGLHQHTTPISLGITTDDKHYFYAEFTDFDRSQVNDWIQENVVDKLRLINKPDSEDDYYEASRHTDNPEGECIYNSYNVTLAGTREEISKELKKWIQQFGNEPIQFVSDVCHYDFVLLCELFGGALNLPHNVCPFCKDVNQMLGDVFKGDYHYAFDINREEFIKFKPDKKHNARHDAIVIKKVHQRIINLFKDEK